MADPAHVLVLEPARTLLTVYERVIAARDLQCRVAEGVGQAMVSIVRQKPLAIVASLELDGLPASSLLAALRASPRHRAIPVAIATSSDAAQARLARLNPDAILRKWADLGQTLGAFLDSVGLTRSKTKKARLSGRVLVVDDVAVSRMLFATILHVAGAEVVVAANGFEAIEIVGGSEAFDLVLMDIQMPELNGVEAARRMRELGATSPIVALTGSPEGVHGEFDAVLDKTRGPRALVSGCRPYLGSRTAAA